MSSASRPRRPWFAPFSIAVASAWDTVTVVRQQLGWRAVPLLALLLGLAVLLAIGVSAPIIAPFVYPFF